MNIWISLYFAPKLRSSFNPLSNVTFAVLNRSQWKKQNSCNPYPLIYCFLETHNICTKMPQSKGNFFLEMYVAITRETTIWLHSNHRANTSQWVLNVNVFYGQCTQLIVAQNKNHGRSFAINDALTGVTVEPEIADMTTQRNRMTFLPMLLSKPLKFLQLIKSMISRQREF